MAEQQAKSRRGFAGMNPELQRRIASKGGRTAHEKGTAHEWTGGAQGTAKAAGHKGGMAASAVRRGAVAPAVEE